MATYDRAPSAGVLELLKPGGFLAPLIALNRRKVSGLNLDVHFRARDEVHVCCGGTVVLTVQRLMRPNGHVSVKADDAYAVQACANGFFRQWSISEHGFATARDAYLSDVKIGPRWTEGEGAIQSLWSQATKLWVPFDREAVLAHPEPNTEFTEVVIAQTKLIQISSAEIPAWSAPPEPSKGRSEVDQIAIDQDGRLVLIELKDASAGGSEVYYAPYQLLQYVWEWHNALEEVRSDLQKVIDARVQVGLSREVPPLTVAMRAAVGFGLDKRTDEVKHRYNRVLGIVNEHRPHGVDPIETWEYLDSGPRQLV